MKGVTHYTGLVCWQLADALRIHIFSFTKRPPYSNDWKARQQIEDAIESVCRNIAEGFGRESHADFARFLVYARSSLNEVNDCARGARLKGYISPHEHDTVYALSHRLYPALGALTAYLHRTRHRRPSPRSFYYRVPRTDER